MLKSVSEYTYKLPEGYEWTPELRLKFDLIVAETDLFEDEAQRLIDFHFELVKSYQEETSK